MNSIFRSELRDYFVMCSELSESRGLLLYRNRVVVQVTLRSEILRNIHDGHLGLAKCRARAQDSVWWPGITQDIRREDMKNMFARWGVPEELVSDNGKQFTSEAFHVFAAVYKFRQTFTSPDYPQFNGEAESAVKIAKRTLRQDDIFKGLLSYRHTLIEETGQSPS